MNSHGNELFARCDPCGLFTIQEPSPAPAPSRRTAAKKRKASGSTKGHTKRKKKTGRRKADMPVSNVSSIATPVTYIDVENDEEINEVWPQLISIGSRVSELL